MKFLPIFRLKSLPEEFSKYSPSRNSTSSAPLVQSKNVPMALGQGGVVSMIFLSPRVPPSMMAFPPIMGLSFIKTLDDAIRLIGHHGRHTVLRKRVIPLSLLDYWLFLFEWKGKLYVDIFLPFGLRTSPLIFNLFSEGLHWILEWLFDCQLVHSN